MTDGAILLAIVIFVVLAAVFFGLGHFLIDDKQGSGLLNEKWGPWVLFALFIALMFGISQLYWMGKREGQRFEREGPSADQIKDYYESLP